ncbi:hypothetical protein Pint_00258 [Pistacia integerrima]|uniref:Uncharacterized protein n=1 Tax=Pistacia integerrima TaxID=434235 RepID=A0ACC0ZHF5_9ROSI|nr:hypothetical protein Pint_00258 [Pistacia integerrima]
MKIRSFQEVKIQRAQKLQDLATSLLELWSLMDTPVGEQQMFQHVTKNIAASEHEIIEPNMLSVKNIKYVEGEVSRLEQLKSSKMKELVLKRRFELEEICKKMHMTTEVLGDYSIKAIESGSVDPVHLLEQLELQIDKVKAEAFSRKEILEKVEKWFAAREEECWLEEYNRDDNRYNAGRGSHLTLKRAEKARALVNKIPAAMVESLTSKITAWEKERGAEFLYDGVRLLSMLEEYTDLRQEKEQERQRQRDQKRLKGQAITEKEAIYGSKLSPSKSGKKATRTLSGATSNRKLSLGGEMLHNLKSEKASVRVHSNKKFECLNRNSPQINHQQSGSFATCSGRRTSEIAGDLVKKRPSGAAKAREVESQLVRKPLSPISLAISSKANIANFLEDQKRTQNETLQKPLAGSNTAVVTPSKSTFVGNEENKTPRTIPIPVPTTPSTVTIPMLMAMTPATPSVSFGAKAVKKIVENVEYSFEEVRAGFLCH